MTGTAGYRGMRGSSHIVNTDRRVGTSLWNRQRSHSPAGMRRRSPVTAWAPPRAARRRAR